MKSIITYTSYDGKITSENPSDVKNYELKNINKHKVYTSQDSSFSVFKVDNEPFFKCLIENLASYCTETINPPCYVVWEPYANNNSGTFTSLETYKKSEAWRDKLLADFEFAQPERLLDNLEEIVTGRVETITVKYREHEYRWAIIHPAGHPLDVQEYCIEGEELISGTKLWDWTARDEYGLPFEPGPIVATFPTKEEALAALPKYKNSWALPG